MDFFFISKVSLIWCDALKSPLGSGIWCYFTQIEKIVIKTQVKYLKNKNPEIVNSPQVSSNKS